MKGKGEDGEKGEDLRVSKLRICVTLLNFLKYGVDFKFLDRSGLKVEGGVSNVLF